MKYNAKDKLDILELAKEDYIFMNIDRMNKSQKNEFNCYINDHEDLQNETVKLLKALTTNIYEISKVRNGESSFSDIIDIINSLINGYVNNGINSEKEAMDRADRALHEEIGYREKHFNRITELFIQSMVSVDKNVDILEQLKEISKLNGLSGSQSLGRHNRDDEEVKNLIYGLKRNPRMNIDGGLSKRIYKLYSGINIKA